MRKTVMLLMMAGVAIPSLASAAPRDRDDRREARQEEREDKAERPKRPERSEQREDRRQVLDGEHTWVEKGVLGLPQAEQPAAADDAAKASVRAPEKVGA